MEIAAFVDLFKSYCANYRYKETPESAAKAITFITFDPENITASLKTARYPVGFLIIPEVDFGAESIDAITESFESTFMVLMPLPGNNIQKKEEILDKAKKIIDQFIRRMISDNASGIIQGLNIAGIKTGTISRTGDSLFGWEASFNMVEDFDGEVQPDMWEDLD